jgi:hypothetical protein
MSPPAVSRVVFPDAGIECSDAGDRGWLRKATRLPPKNRHQRTRPATGNRVILVEIRRDYAKSVHGIRFAKPEGVETLAHALNSHFDGVCQAELQRLRKKTASLAQRAEVEALAAQVVRAIAASTVAAWAADGTRTDPVVRQLFGLAEGHDDQRSGVA